MRYVVGFVLFLLALGTLRVVGCGDDERTGGTGGVDLCDQLNCDDHSPCTEDTCDPNEPSFCVFTAVPEGETCELEEMTGFCDGVGNCVECDDENQCTEDFWELDSRICMHPNHGRGYPCGLEDREGVCDGAGECVECNVVEDCRLICIEGACNQETLKCEEGSFLPRNTPCIVVNPRSTVEGFCDGAGECFECIEDAQCASELNDCMIGTCDSAAGKCHDPIAAPDGTPCAGGVCDAGSCALTGLTMPCSEHGIRNAIAAGGGPYTFDCDGLNTVLVRRSFDIERDVVLDGEGALTVDGGMNPFRQDDVFGISENATAVIRGFAILRGVVRNHGVLTLEDCLVSSNIIGIDNYGQLTMARSAITNNESGITNVGELTIVESAITNNDVGIRVSGTTTMLTNSTVSGNEVGLYGNLVLMLNNSTVAGNTEWAIGGDAVITMANSVVVGECEPLEVFSKGHNIESPGSTCGFDQLTDQVNVSTGDLNLGELADNGGPTMTHALGAGSVAINQIPGSACLDAEGQPLTTDQRGEPRDSRCDVGAFEVQP